MGDAHDAVETPEERARREAMHYAARAERSARAMAHGEALRFAWRALKASARAWWEAR